MDPCVAVRLRQLLSPAKQREKLLWLNRRAIAQQSDNLISLSISHGFLTSTRPLLFTFVLGTSRSAVLCDSSKSRAQNARDPAAMRWLASLAGYVAPLFLVLSPVFSYSDQVVSMYRNKSSAGFSLDIPLIMLVASMLRSVCPQDFLQNAR